MRFETVLLWQVGTAMAVPLTNHIRATTSSSVTLYLPQSDPNQTARAAELSANKAGYLYGPSPLGNLSFFPAGTLGNARWQNDVGLFSQEAQPISILAQNESQAAAITVTQQGGLVKLSDYSRLYDKEWLGTDPLGPESGSLTNYTQDLFFSMQRLSNNAFSTKRLNPASDKLPFTVSDTIVKNLTGTTLALLFSQGRLFVSDHSDLAAYAADLGAGHYGAACTGLFYIDPTTSNFLPLAIKTNTGANLVYTPLDTANDWLLAKMMFNNNDEFHGQIYHLAGSHAVAEIAYLAALRSLSAAHPMRAYLDRVMFRSFAIRPVGAASLFNSGGPFDQVFSLNSTAALGWAADHYKNDAGAFQGNYLFTRLAKTGLLNCTFGPALAHFPFAEDASLIWGTIAEFTNSFVNAYYTSDAAVAKDTEIQAWVKEANGPAQIIDFPAAINDRLTLVGALTHISYLSAIVHNALNANSGFAATGVLPLSPGALYQPIPTAKGVTNVVPWLPNLQLSITQIGLLTAFNRANYTNTGNDMINMFSAPSFVSNSNSAVTSAVTTFVSKMGSISNLLEARTFDSNGLSQGMPFIWKLLDPRVSPYFLAI